MKHFAATIILLAAVFRANAATQVTVAQLEQSLAGARTQPDARVADQLSAVELSQRLSLSTFSRLQSQLPGPQSASELSILAARSSFLGLPQAEIPSTPPPDVAEQRRIIGLVVAYVTQTINGLPNFLATRNTRSF